GVGGGGGGRGGGAEGGRGGGAPRGTGLDLDERTGGGRGGGLRHRVRRGERDRIGGGDGLGCGEGEKLVHRPPGALGREIPECAVERVARRARRPGGLQALAIKTPGNVRTHRPGPTPHPPDPPPPTPSRR